VTARPSQITEEHLRRNAIVYIRQSSIQQVRENTGSTALQRDLRPVLEAWGWRHNQIEVVDDDLGVTGAAAGLRNGFNRVVEQMKSGKVGIVAVVDASRLGGTSWIWRASRRPLNGKTSS
jgi:DNA invertase Pin-like site-specific DNA recombinase